MTWGAGTGDNVRNSRSQSLAERATSGEFEA